jgi:hypothetical protein
MEVHRLRLTGTQGTQEEKPTQKKEGLELVYVFHSDLDLEAAAESEPAVPPGRRRPAQHLPHHVHVLVLARAHLLPQPPQPCKESRPRRPESDRAQPGTDYMLCCLPVWRTPKRDATPSQTRRTGSTTRSHQ